MQIQCYKLKIQYFFLKSLYSIFDTKSFTLYLFQHIINYRLKIWNRKHSKPKGKSWSLSSFNGFDIQNISLTCMRRIIDFCFETPLIFIHL